MDPGLRAGAGGLGLLTQTRPCEPQLGRWRGGSSDLVFVNTINLTETCLPLRVRVAQPYARDFAAPPGLLHDSDSRARIPLSRRQLLF